MSAPADRGGPREEGAGVRVYRDPAEVARAAAQEFVEAARRSIAGRGAFHAALSGGTTPRTLYRLLGSEEFRSTPDWTRVQLYWVDERCVPPDHPESNFGVAQREMLAKISIPSGNVHRMPADRPDLERAAQEYEEILRRNLPIDAEGFPRFDLIFLGMGADGHTASLFPGGDGTGEAKLWVIAPFVEKFHAHRMTLTLPLLNAAHQVIFLVTGADKFDALRALVAGTSSPPLPAQQVTVPNGQRLLLVDDAAAGRLNV
jgi:6-phosphogluconolactonase